MLAELKDLVQKGLFTAVSFYTTQFPPLSIETAEIYNFAQAETKQIMKKRTVFEMALVRRVAKKSDFVRYAAYEMSLEQLRRKRLERLRVCN
jgi:U3 small nucleolar RNA-associated protein 6